MTTAILAILLFCIMIFPHELGHFIAARAMGVKVNEFAFGMGPVLWKKQGKETLYSIRLFPVGGFCAMEGEDGEEEDENGQLVVPDERSFCAKKPWQKMIILAAGSFMNVTCAVLIMSLVLGIMGFTTNKIGEVLPDSPAEQAGLLAGDEIIAINGKPVETWNDVMTCMPEDGSAAEIYVDGRNGERLLTVQPELQDVLDADGNVTGQKYAVGITTKISHSPFKALVSGTQATWNIGKMIFESLGMLFSGEAGADDLTGPVGMVQMVSNSVDYGFWYYGFLTAMICVNLAIINMLPLPALDGGRIIFVLITLITGKKVSEKIEGTVHMLGMALLLGLMVYVCFNDVIRIFFSGQ